MLQICPNKVRDRIPFSANARIPHVLSDHVVTKSAWDEDHRAYLDGR